MLNWSQTWWMRAIERFPWKCDTIFKVYLLCFFGQMPPVGRRKISEFLSCVYHAIPADLARSISIPADPFLRISDRVKKIRIEKWKINAAVGGEKRKLDRSYGSGIKYSMFVRETQTFKQWSPTQSVLFVGSSVFEFWSSKESNFSLLSFHESAILYF